jgi:hypothetical protein
MGFLVNPVDVKTSAHAKASNRTNRNATPSLEAVVPKSAKQTVGFNKLTGKRSDSLARSVAVITTARGWRTSFVFAKQLLSIPKAS